MIYLVLLFFHLLVCGLIFLGMHTGFLNVHKYMFLVALLVPLWGALVILVLHFQIAFDAHGQKDIDVEKMKLDSELYKSIHVDDKKVASKTVPIEEALVVNSPVDRRSIIMDVLNDNPKEYVEFLRKAGDNDDTEVVHYAVTAMVEISKENDEKLLMLEARYKENPDDYGVISDYTDFLWSCLSQNLMQGQVEVINRELYTTLMQKKISIIPSLLDYTNLALNTMKQKNYSLAASCIDKIKELYPTREDYYILKLQYLAEIKRGEDIKKLIEEAQNSNIYFSSKAKEALAFWEN